MAFINPAVGRIVHFFTKDQARQSNGQGEGPYPAIVLQAFDGDAGMANLKVMTWTGDYIAGSVVNKESAGDAAQWWDWPPRT